MWGNKVDKFNNFIVNLDQIYFVSKQNKLKYA